MKNTPETLAKRNALRQHWKDVTDPATIPPYQERVCLGCGEAKPCKWNSSFTQTGKPEYKTRCDDCVNKKNRDYTKQNRPTLTSQRLDRQYSRKVDCVEYKGGECQRCGYKNCIKALTFHHIDPAVKSFEISRRLDAPWEVLVEELDKCLLLCFNCHMEEHCEQDHAAREGLKRNRAKACNHTLEKEWA